MYVGNDWPMGTFLARFRVDLLLLLVAASWGSTYLVAKAHRVANQIAIRLKSQPGVWEKPTDMAGAICQLDGVIAWCDGLNAAPRVPELEASAA